MGLTIKSLSSRSVPASNNNLAGPGVWRNLEERPVNQDGQYGFVAPRSVNQVNAVKDWSSCLSNAGTETQADRVFRMVRLRMCHSIAEGRDGKGAEVGFHGSKGVHCAAFDNVEDGVAKELKVEEAVVRRMCYYSTAEGVAHY